MPAWVIESSKPECGAKDATSSSSCEPGMRKAENATPSKIAATKAYGAEVVLHGTIWDEANDKARQLVEERGLTYIHPFDDPQLIMGQGTVGLEILEDLPDVDAVFGTP